MSQDRWGRKRRCSRGCAPKPILGSANERRSCPARAKRGSRSLRHRCWPRSLARPQTSGLSASFCRQFHWWSTMQRQSLRKAQFDCTPGPAVAAAKLRPCRAAASPTSFSIMGCLSMVGSVAAKYSGPRRFSCSGLGGAGGGVLRAAASSPRAAWTSRVYSDRLPSAAPVPPPPPYAGASTPRPSGSSPGRRGSPSPDEACRPGCARPVGRY